MTSVTGARIISRAGAQVKKIEGALAPALELYCQIEGARSIRPGRGRKGRPRSALLRAPPSPGFMSFIKQKGKGEREALDDNINITYTLLWF